MTVEECIEVAEHGLDGKTPSRAPSGKPPTGGAHRPLTVAEAVKRMLQRKEEP
jgi:hypothetical protein